LLSIEYSIPGKAMMYVRQTFTVSNDNPSSHSIDRILHHNLHFIEFQRNKATKGISVGRME
jgi:hypothetical protein